MNIFRDADVAINLNVGRTRVPFAFHGMHRRRTNLVELGSHILLLGYSVDGIVVHQNLQTLLVNADSPCNLRWLDLDLHCDACHKLLYSTLHQVDCAEVVVVGLPTSEARLNEEAGDGLQHRLWRRLVGLINPKGFNPSRQCVVIRIWPLNLGWNVCAALDAVHPFEITCGRLWHAAPFIG